MSVTTYAPELTQVKVNGERISGFISEGTFLSFGASNDTFHANLRLSLDSKSINYLKEKIGDKVVLEINLGQTPPNDLTSFIKTMKLVSFNVQVSESFPAVSFHLYEGDE